MRLIARKSALLFSIAVFAACNDSVANPKVITGV